MAIKMDSTIIIQVKGVIEMAGEPLRFNDIKERVSKNINLDSLRVTLSLMVRKKIVLKVKFTGTSSFYCKPEWVDTVHGKILIEGFDPHWGTKKATK